MNEIVDFKQFRKQKLNEVSLFIQRGNGLMGQWEEKGELFLAMMKNAEETIITAGFDPDQFVFDTESLGCFMVEDLDHEPLNLSVSFNSVIKEGNGLILQAMCVGQHADEEKINITSSLFRVRDYLIGNDVCEVFDFRGDRWLTLSPRIINLDAVLLDWERQMGRKN